VVPGISSSVPGVQSPASTVSRARMCCAYNAARDWAAGNPRIRLPESSSA
jgi:hypothetical protein